MDKNYLDLTNVQSIAELDLTAIPHNKYWDTGDERELKMHRIHAYPAKFPAFITSKALAYAKHNELRITRLADIFCGCGTAAYEARRNNIDFWGCDINPVATLIARTKSATYDLKRLEKYSEAIIYASNNASKEVNLDKNAVARLNYWFTKNQYESLAQLLNAIHQEVPKKSIYHDFFICAFSNILKTSSRWLQKSIKPTIDQNKVSVDPQKSFRRQVNFMINACRETGHQLESKITIRNSNFLSTNTKSIGNVDMIVTSPPYVTSYEYADLHQLSSLWLGYANDFRDLRNGSIGSTQHDFNFNRESKRLNTTATKIVFSLYDKDPNIAKSVAKYYLDMQQVANKCSNVLNENGRAIFVIGNTQYKDVYVDNARHLAESLMASGFKKISIAKRKISNKILTPYRDSNGRFTNDKTGRKIYSDEFVLIAAR